MAQIQPVVEVSGFVTDQPDSQLSFTAYTPGTVFDIGGSKLSHTLGPLLEEKLFALTGRQLIKADGTRQRLLPSALLSDDTGLNLWRQVNRLPDYYQTRDEIELLANFGAQIAKLVPENATLIDLGAGDVRKVQPLLDALELGRKPILYLALDLSRSSLESGLAELAPRYHHVQCFGLWGSFNDDLGWMDYLSGPRWLLSLGSILGNDWHSGAVLGMSRFAQRLHSADRILLGMDSCKNRATIWRSYHDKRGTFQQFIRNGLARANDIIGCHWYRPEDWMVEGLWNEEPLMHSFQITALRDVVVDALGVKLVKGTRLDCYEAFKYDPWEMHQTFAESGLDLLHTWTSPSERIVQYLLAPARQV